MFEKYKQLLSQFVSFKSISTDPSYKKEVEKTVLWLKNLLQNGGFKTKIWKGRKSNPVVFGNYFVSPKFSTVLIYGHYDVQPAKKSDGWKSEPFALKETKSKLIARGVVDNKGQILAHIVTAINLIKNKSLKYNVKFLIEGNEESGNADLPTLMKKNKKDMECNIVMVSDGELTNGKPTIETSLRGGFNTTLTYKTGKTNLHSGGFGGAVPNAAIELTRFLSNLFTTDGSITFNNFYQGVDPVTAQEKANNKTLTKESKDITKLAGVNSLLMPLGTNFYTQTGLTPTIQITGLKSGYIETGYANIVPSTAEARLNFRLVTSQKPQNVAKDFEKYVQQNTPEYVDFKISFTGFHNPIKVNTQNPYISKVEQLLKQVYGAKVNKKNVGGAIPFVADVKETLGADTLLVPFCNEDCNMHGINENFDKSLIEKALDFSKEFFST